MLNPEKKSELIKIVRRVLHGNATPGEKRFLEEYYDYFDNNRFKPKNLSHSERKALEDKIIQQIYQKINLKEEGKRGLIPDYKWLKIAAAVAIFIVVGGIYYQYKNSAHSKDNASELTKQFTGNDVAPGGNKAILTLSNGSQMVLGSAHNGMLATQGKSSVIKINNGQIAYTEGDATTNSGTRASGNSVTVKYNTLTTPRGGQYQITLSDGTKVWLNSASSLTFPVAFTGSERKVTLTGEAYFEVRENKSEPFKVKAGNMEVEDLGTRFDVMAYKEEPVVKATLLEGSVKVTRGNTNKLLKPGQQAEIQKGSSEKINVSKVNTEDVVAWKEGYFSFYRTSIYEIMRQISRWYDVNVSYRDSLHVYLNGNISRNVNVSEVFKMLEMTGVVKFTITGKNITVRKHD